MSKVAPFGSETPLELDGEHGHLGPLGVLDELVASARVAFLVEMDHCVHERHGFRLLCLRYLAVHGWRWFGEELDWRQGERTDAYLQAGDEALLEPVDDGNWYTSGILAGTRADPALTAAMNHERQQFARALRRTLPGVRYFGFDVGGGDDEYLRAANQADSLEALAEVMSLREQLIRERIEAVWADNPDEKIVLMGGSTHLMKDDRLVDAPGMMTAGGGRTESIGHHLTSAVGGSVVSIWLLHGGGRTANPWLAASGGQIEVPPDTVNAALADRWQQPCLAAVSPSAGEQRVAQMHNLVLTCDLASQVDAIVFCPTVTPARVDDSDSA